MVKYGAIIIVLAITAGILAFADAQHTIELPLLNHSDWECENAVFYMDRYFRTYPAVRTVHFTNQDWIPFPNPLDRDWFYLHFADCIVHDGACHPFFDRP